MRFLKVKVFSILVDRVCTCYTHVKISQLVTSLQTSRQQDVFALLVPSLSTTCNKLDENIRLVTRLF